MKMLFLVNESLLETNGISKKILAQVKAIRGLSAQVDICYLQGNENKFAARYINETRIEKYSDIAFLNKLQWRCSYQRIYKYIVENNTEVLYIRYIHYGNPFFNSFLKRVKKEGIKILLELPTYPYDQEYRNIKFASKLVMLIERFSRKKFKRYVERIITLSDHTEIFGIPTVQISNGIDPDVIPIIKRDSIDENIHLIGVASIGFWHGYDRVIEGMKNYYAAGNDKKIFFHIVGDSNNPESVKYKKLVKKYGLTNYIFFYGKKSGKELDELFNKANIAVGSLGCHRISVNNIRSLKSREYCARGMAFFYSATDVDFEHQNFILKVPANDEPIDINSIISFIQAENRNPIDIRRYAVENLSWGRQFEKIFEELYPLLHPEKVAKIIISKLN